MSQTLRIAASPDTATAPLVRFLQTAAGRFLARLLLVLIILTAWQVLPTKGLRFWMSGPVQIVARLWSWILDGSLWGNLGATLLAMALGYAIGTGTGIVLGLLFGLLPRLHRVLSPYINALYAMPKIALAPLFVITLGIGIESKVALVADHRVLPGAEQHAGRRAQRRSRPDALARADGCDAVRGDRQGPGAGDAAVDLRGHADCRALRLHQHAARRIDRVEPRHRLHDRILFRACSTRPAPMPPSSCWSS